MKTSFRLAAGLALLVGSLNCFAQSGAVGHVEVTAEAISIDGNGHQRSFPCNGRKLVVAGSDHVITVTGVCSRVEISGANNKIDAALAPKGTLDVAGSGHTVRWKSTGEPSQDISGVDHKISRVK